MQLHPKDTGATFFEIDEQLGADAHVSDGPWEPAGPNWQRARQIERVSGIVLSSPKSFKDVGVSMPAVNVS